MNSLHKSNTKSFGINDSIVINVLVSVGIFCLFIAISEIQGHGIGSGLYKQLMLASMMFSAASELKSLKQGFISYIKSTEPTPKLTSFFMLLSVVFFLLWIISSVFI
jgi:hypothetical protein